MANLLTIEIRGQVKTMSAIEAFIKGADVEEILDATYAVLLNRIRTRFHQQTAPSGERWIPSQAAIDENRNTLIKTGRLFRSIQLYQKSSGMRLIGTDVPYAPYLHFGSIRGGIARPFMAFNSEDLSLVEKMIKDRFTKV